MNRYWMISVALLVTAPVTAAAQQVDSVRLRELVVTATRLETPIEAVPGTVTVVTGESMREQGHRFLVDALRAAPGVVFAQSAGPGALTSLFVRGGESDYVQVLIDGVQVNAPGGAFDWAHLRTEDVERVEIVRGPASVLYGSDAVSGVIQIFTRAGGPPRIEAGITSSRGDKQEPRTGAAYDTHAFDASLTGSTAASRRGSLLRYGLSAAHATSTGLFAFNSDYDNTNVSGRLQLHGLRADAALTARVTDTEYHYPTSGSGAVFDRNQFATGGTRSLGIDAGYRALAAVEVRILAALHQADSRTENPADSDDDGMYWSTTEQLRRSIDGRVNIELPRATVLTAGAEREWQEAQTAFESVSSFGSFTDETDDDRANTGFYAQLHGAPLHRVSVTIGGRIDDNEAFGTFRTARAAASWRPAPAARLHASFGTAFKEPTFFENFATGFARGNPELVPERTRSWEAGADYAAFAGRVTFGVTWFDQRFLNLIQYTFNTPTPEDPNYFNVGAARARGAEVSASAGLRSLNATASYTRTSTRVLDDGFGEDMAFQEGRRLLRRPDHQAAVTASLQVTPFFSTQLGARWVGERDDLDFTDPDQFSGIRTTLDDYAVADAGVSYSPVRAGVTGVDISAGIRNVFDTAYQEIYNFPAPGRVFYLGVRAALGL